MWVAEHPISNYWIWNKLIAIRSIKFRNIGLLTKFHIEWQLETTVKERQEKMKAEMLEKLKGFGNSILGKFGMSTDNFKMVQDPKTGGYNISFQQ